MAAFSILILCPIYREHYIRYAGLLLETVGTVVVLVEIYSSYTLFWNKIKDWICEFPLLPPKPINMLLNSAKLELEVQKSTIYLGLNENLTIEKQIQTLDENIKSINNRIDKMEQELKEKIKTLNENLKEEEHKREQRDSKIQETLEKTATDGIHISCISVFLLIFGNILSTLSPEIASLINHIN